MIEWIDETMRERIAQPLVDAFRLNLRNASTVMLQVAVMLIVTSLLAQVVWTASLGIAQPPIIALGGFTIAMVVYLIRIHVRRIDRGHAMHPGMVMQRIIILMMATNNIVINLLICLMLTQPRIALMGNIAEIAGWTLIPLGIYIRICRKPPPREDRKLATA